MLVTYLHAHELGLYIENVLLPLLILMFVMGDYLVVKEGTKNLNKRNI